MIGKRSSSLLLLFCAALSPLGAQAPTAGPPSPTMEQTIAFINELYTNQGVTRLESQYVQIEDQPASFATTGPCEMTMTTASHMHSSIGGNGHDKDDLRAVVFALDQTDANSVSIQRITEGSTPTPFYVAIGQTRSRPVAPTADPTAPAVVFLKGVSVNGYIARADSASWVVITSHRQTFTLGGNDLKVKLKMFNDDQRVVSYSDAKAGDYVEVNPRGAKDLTVTLQSIPGGVSGATLPGLSSNDAATRMAKALIHAVVLCHKNDKPSLF